MPSVPVPLESSAEASGLSLPACLVIMDGFGLSDRIDGNAIRAARTPVLDSLFDLRPWTTLQASGEAVGLPSGQMGNSEVGHLNIGAGRVVFQELTRINRACADGSFSRNEILRRAFDAANAPGAALHVMGLLSDGGVHSSNAHLYALLRAARDAGVPRILIHCFMDGRDVSPTSGLAYIKDLMREIHALTDGEFDGSCRMEIASISGRYYAMDRDNRWDRVQRAYESIVEAQNYRAASPLDIMQDSYDDDVTDEFILPVSLVDRGVSDGDSIVFFNFRPDRAREISRAITDDDFKGFERARKPDVFFVCMTEYDPDIDAAVAFEKEFPDMVLADVLSNEGLHQYHIAETEKYAHVTFFLNGGREEEKLGESRTLISSPKVSTYDLKPEMSAWEVVDTLCAAIESNESDVYIVNFANCDMVGHTGIFQAAVKAVEVVDKAVGKIIESIKKQRGVCLITADHGNADMMIAADGSPHTAHTTAPVPLILVDERDLGWTLDDRGGVLADIAPTFIELIGLDVPTQMTGRSLLARPCAVDYNS